MLKGIDLLDLFERVDAFRVFTILEELVRENEVEDLKTEGRHKNVMSQIKKITLMEGEEVSDQWTGTTTNVEGKSYKVIDNFVTPDMENLSQFGIAPAG